MAKAKLGEYRKKRDPKKTPEPFGGRKRGKRPIFVVQRHDARRLHYDFRLERDGALASWAVPKGVPLESGQRALAVHVEDHPLEYATFEGEIPKGQYGAGTVEVWDSGTYELVEEKKDGGLTVRLHGKRLNGTWTLVPAKLDGDPKNWLLLRKRDETPAPNRPKPGECALTSRKGNDLTARFAEVAKAIAKGVKTPSCLLDGEVCALDENGKSSFSAMQQAKAGTPFVYYVFDLLEV